jgi:hypothetical protein
MKVRYLVLPIILAGVLSAQGRQFRGGGSLTPPTPAQLVEREVSFLTKFFTLTPTQVTAVTGFVTTEQTCLAANTTNLQTAREALVTAIKGANPTTISTAISNLSAVQSAQETCRATAAAAIYADLTSAQQAKVGSGLGPLMGGGGGPHFGPHAGGPPPAH